MEEIRIVTAQDAAYPLRFAGLSQMPSQLYVRGRLPADDQLSCAIVGARMCTHYGHRMAETFGAYLAARGVQIVSGMALGIDGYALQGSLAVGGAAFAVLGCGADICYPKTNRKIYEAMQTQGGIISEEEPGTPPMAHNFPKRNRIISALADIVLVVEARLKSGSLYTVDHALEQGRPVFAMPGHVGDPLSDGCHFLISQGAEIARSPEALYSFLTELDVSARMRELRKMRKEMRRKLAGEDASIYKKEKQRKEELAALCRTLTTEEARLVDLLAEKPMHTDEIGMALAEKKAPMAVSALSAMLVSLKLRGVVEEAGKNIFVLRDP